eukprot:COSAG01_NODE_6911_length_3443_cov_3.818746_6_plen_77_part_00
MSLPQQVLAGLGYATQRHQQDLRGFIGAGRAFVALLCFKLPIISDRVVDLVVIAQLHGGFVSERREVGSRRCVCVP